MSDLVLYALGAIFSVFLVTVYKAKTTQMALYARNAMSILVRDILEDRTVPQELKDVAANMFHWSVRPSFLLRILWVSFRYPQKGRGEPTLQTEHQRYLDTLVRDHLFRVNILAAPHWYAIAAALFFVIAVGTIVLSLGFKSGYSILSRIESILFNPRLNQGHE